MSGEVLRVSGGNLYFKETRLPILERATKAWFNKYHFVQIQCRTNRGYPYEVFVSLDLRTADKVQQCLKLLFENTQIKTFIPSRQVFIEPPKVFFHFNSKEAADTFNIFYSNVFFPAEEFHSSQYENIYHLTYKGKPEDADNCIRNALKRLDSSDCSNEPLKEPKFYDFSNTYKINFTTDGTTICETYYGADGKKINRFSSSREIEAQLLKKPENNVDANEGEETNSEEIDPETFAALALSQKQEAEKNS